MFDLSGEFAMAGQGSTGNVIAAVCSFLIPGLGQLVQGRTFKALIMFLLWCVLWFIWLGWIMHIIAPIDAALWKRRT
jgi:TM2 domain-containing membrane protein YozV